MSYGKQDEQILLLVYQLISSICNKQLQSVRSVTLELNERLTPEIVDAYLQRLLWEKDVVNSSGLALELFRIKVLHPEFTIMKY